MFFNIKRQFSIEKNHELLKVKKYFICFFYHENLKNFTTRKFWRGQEIMKILRKSGERGGVY